MGSWQSFADGEVYDEIVSRLLIDQRGICAYCEVDLIVSDGCGYSDIRVEHFHPKSDSHPNWTFRWDNLLLTCCGGNRNYLSLGAHDRFTSPDHSCDVPKENKILDGIIFHPAEQVQLRNLLFKYSMDGQMEVSNSCPQGLKDQALATISELYLSPKATVRKSKNSTPRLVRMRSAFLSGLQDQVQVFLEEGLSIEQIFEILANTLFPDDEGQNWTKFFSCARWYLGAAAEDRLSQLGYI